MSAIARAAHAVVVAVALCAALVARGGAQAPDRGVEFEDLGLDRWLDASVRGAALSAFAATTNDAAALAYNPAGLARAKRMTATVAFAGTHSSFDYSYHGSPRAADEDEVALQFMAAAFPLPVFRGSLVPAVGVQRVFTSSLDFSYAGFNAPDARDDRFFVHQSGATYAYHVGAAVDLSSVISAGASFMLLDGNVDRVRQYDTRSMIINPNVHTFVYEETTADVDGYGARFGLQLYALEKLQLALSLVTSLVVETEATIVTEETRQVDNDVGTFTRETITELTEYKVPYRIEGALAVPASRSLLLTAQVAYADWSQATIDDQRLITSDLESVLRSVVDVRAGVEWTSSRWPLRVRAGFARARRPMSFLEADRIDMDQLERVSAESVSTRYSLGAGWLLRESIVVDTAAWYGSGERSSDTIDDRRESASLSIGFGYWF